MSEYLWMERVCDTVGYFTEALKGCFSSREKKLARVESCSSVNPPSCWPRQQPQLDASTMLLQHTIARRQMGRLDGDD